MATKKATQKLRIIIKSYDHHIVDDSAKNILEALERTSALIAGPIPLPTRIRKFSLLRSTNCNKDSFEQFEVRVHKRIIDVNESSADTITTLQSLKMPSGVDIELKML
ncbi:30S ribosomal protein S10 [Candidatus Peregrinibacteria bacterium]|nr:MAG: 30S ribosomal protein S10 [Candidatus Peregrinibacteria bacterium]